MLDDKCPIPSSHEQFIHTHYDISQMLTNYHKPDIFRYNFNAFLQSLRNVTFLLQNELKHKEGFDAWYEHQREFMKQDNLLKKILSVRNMVVKERDPIFTNTALFGLFRNKKLKLGFEIPIDINVYSSQIIEEHKDEIIGIYLDKEHSAIGEEVGIKRKWVVKELGTDEVVSLCDYAWSQIGIVISNAHKFCNSTCDPPSEHGHNIELASVLVESDIDPNLPEKWNWT